MENNIKLDLEEGPYAHVASLRDTDRVSITYRNTDNSVSFSFNYFYMTMPVRSWEQIVEAANQIITNAQETANVR